MSPTNPSFPYESADSSSSVQNKVMEGFENVAHQAARTIHDVADKAGDFANRATEEARAVGGHVQDAAGNLRSTVQQSVQERPMTTLAAFAVAGFVMGALWKS